MKKLILFTALTMVFCFAGFADAALIDRGADSTGNHLIYDTVMDITWYDYWRGATKWDDQVIWANDLTVTMADGRIFTNWRLPATVDGPYEWGYDGTTTAGYNITTSEMGHLFYEELGNKGYQATDGSYKPPGWGLTNVGPFANLHAGLYWSGTEYAEDPSDAWGFNFNLGDQNKGNKGNADVLAVHPGDVAAPIATPEPATMVLLGLGLIGLAGTRRLKK